MNANELADEIGSILYPYCEEAATMLRQQQLEIEALKKENADMNRRLLGWDIYEQ